MLLKNENQIIRVLKSHGDKALVIDCIKRTMFDAFYASGESEYAGVNVLADGTLRIDFLAKNLSNRELIRFHNEPLREIFSC